MGTRNRYFCNECDYEATVSGGNDIGMLAATSTIHCYDCEKILDVVTTDEEPWLAMDDNWVPTDNQCSQSATHRVALWGYPGECPKCNNTMEIAEWNLILWD